MLKDLIDSSLAIRMTDYEMDLTMVKDSWALVQLSYMEVSLFKKVNLLNLSTVLDPSAT